MEFEILITGIGGQWPGRPSSRSVVDMVISRGASPLGELKGA
ncbi:MAG TPA: hypothetical protein VIX85_10745 [Acidimicrobiales bacterium]